MVVSFDSNLYSVVPQDRSQTIPVLVPGVVYERRVRLRSIDRDGAAGVVALHLHRGIVPVRRVEISMPLSEVAALEE